MCSVFVYDSLFQISIFNACRDGNEEEFLHVLEENPQFNLNKIFPNPEIRGGYMVDVIYVNKK